MVTLRTTPPGTGVPLRCAEGAHGSDGHPLHVGQCVDFPDGTASDDLEAASEVLRPALDAATGDDREEAALLRLALATVTSAVSIAEDMRRVAQVCEQVAPHAAMLLEQLNAPHNFVGPVEADRVLGPTLGTETVRNLLRELDALGWRIIAPPETPRRASPTDWPCSTCGQPRDTPGCTPGPDGPAHTYGGGPYATDAT